MSDNAINVDRVFDLTGVICDGTASESELAEMDAYLLSDQEACDRYAGYCWMHVALTMELQVWQAVQQVHQQINANSAIPLISTASELDATTVQAPSPPTSAFLSTTLHGTVSYFSSGWPVAYLVSTVIFLIGALVGSFIYVSRYEQVADNFPSTTIERQLDIPPKPELVGRITGMADCKWADPSKACVSAHVAMGQRCSLVSGLVEITYNTGAKILLQGPATFDVNSENGGFLSLGKLTGKVEVAKAKGFTVHTSTVTVTDLGTEFGVAVNRDGEGGVQVFQGTVRLSTNAAESSERVETLQAGTSVRIKHGQQPGKFIVVTEPAGHATQFVRKLPTAASSDSNYRQTVMADKPLSYWTFDEPKGPAFEQVRHYSGEWLEPVGDASRSEDTPTGTGRAADCSRGGGCFRTITMRRGDMRGAWAIEFWVKFSGDMSSRPMECLVRLGQDDLRKWEWGLWNPAIVANLSKGHGRNELALCYTPDNSTGEGPKVGDACWHHVMFVFFGNKFGFGVADRVDVVFDGKSRTIQRNQFSSGFNMEGRLVVGAADIDLAKPFHGLIDELAFYDFSGLTAQQVAEKAADIAGRHFHLAERERADSASARGQQKNEVRVSVGAQGR